MDVSGRATMTERLDNFEEDVQGGGCFIGRWRQEVKIQGCVARPQSALVRCILLGLGLAVCDAVPANLCWVEFCRYPECRSQVCPSLSLVSQTVTGRRKRAEGCRI